MLNTVKLKFVSKFIGSGITPLRSNFLFWNDGIIPWLKTEQLGDGKIYDTAEKITQYAIDETLIKIFPVNTLSIAMYGEGRTRGNVSILKTAMTTNQACCNIVIDESKANYEFVYYYLKTQYRQLRNLSSGVRKNLNSNDIREFEIRLPEELITQKKIASVLSSLDSKIELNNCVNSELEAMAKMLYEYWFVQFDFPDINGNPFKTSGGAMLWNEELKKNIPVGWEAKKLGDFSEVIRGVTYNKNQIRDSKDLNCLPILRATNIHNSEIDLEDMVYVPKDLVSDRQLLNKYDIVITMSSGSKDHIGKNAFFYFDDIIVSYGAFCAKLLIKENYNLLINIMMHSKDFKTYVSNVCLGTNINNLNNEHIENCLIISPEINTLLKFNKLVGPLFDKIGNNLKENRRLSEMRDWLLPMLMNGQVKFKPSGELKKYS